MCAGDSLFVGLFDLHATVVVDRRPVRLAVIFGHNVKFIFQLVNATPEAKASLNQTIESFRELSPADIRALEVNRIALYKMSSDGGTGALHPPLASWLLDNVAALRFNGFFEAGAGPKAGDLIKWIQ